MTYFDYIVIGIGGMGSAACYALSKRNKSVLGIEQFQIAHANGSSHGETRFIRQAYFEHPDYVPLLQSSYQIWAEIESLSGDILFNKTGIFIAGTHKSQILSGVRTAARQHRLKVEEWDKQQIRLLQKYFQVPESWDVIFEPNAGYLYVEKCVSASVELAARNGCKFSWDTKVVDWQKKNDLFEISTTNGLFKAKKLILCPGPWAASILKLKNEFFQAHRVPLLWLKNKTQIPVHFPCFAFDDQDGFFYGFSPLQNSPSEIKVSLHKPGEPVNDPTHDQKKVAENEMRPITSLAEKFFANMTIDVVREAVCMYTMSPDSHFIIDAHPEVANVYFAAGFSGHGFKFTPVVGEILADLAVNGKTSYPADFLTYARLRSYLS